MLLNDFLSSARILSLYSVGVLCEKITLVVLEVAPSASPISILANPRAVRLFFIVVASPGVPEPLKI